MKLVSLWGSHIGLAGVLGLALLLLPLTANAGGGAAASSKGSSGTSPRELQRKIDALEQQNQALQEQNRAIQKQLAQQAAEIGTLNQQMAATTKPIQQLEEEHLKIRGQVAAYEQHQHGVPFTVGFRSGYAQSPYNMPGGPFYSAFINHRLLTSEDGVPFGDVSGELMAGAVLGGSVKSCATLTCALGLGQANTWEDTIEIEPTVQYRLDMEAAGLSSLKALRPYALAGPGMWINLMSTPIVNGPGTGARFRHTDADFQPGGEFGVGFQLSLGELISVPAIQNVLEATNLGGEWRYNLMTNGEAFNQYTGTVAFGW